MEVIPTKPYGCSRRASPSNIESSRAKGQPGYQTSPTRDKDRNLISSRMKVQPHPQTAFEPEDVVNGDRVTAGDGDSNLAPMNAQRSVIYVTYTCVNKSQLLFLEQSWFFDGPNYSWPRLIDLTNSIIYGGRRKNPPTDTILMYRPSNHRQTFRSCRNPDRCDNPYK